ncbi:hypothetical protein Q9L58_009025 [Maublancomyces gigas]|uniref:F-box domain-containing protein n=1 Tax=Discina gigas TaxID=1032678 RepID=A0ABR3G8F4_9PEZI
MSLLALPNELLLDIFCDQLSTPVPNCCGDDSHFTSACTPPNATTLAHICQSLRSFSLPFMYASVTANPESVQTLHELLTTSAQIASCVRDLRFFVTDASSVQIVLKILVCCTNLHSLRLDASHAQTGIAATLLNQLSGQRHLSMTLRCFPWDEITCYIKSNPKGLQMLSIMGSTTHPLILAFESPTAAREPLTDVHTFTWDTGKFCPRVSVSVGQHIARMMPNVQMLDLTITQYGIPLLQSYAELGSRLTDLTVHFRSKISRLCSVVAQLAPSLRRYVAHGGDICQVLFSADWESVEYMDVVCHTGCKSAQPADLREAILRLVCRRPKARVRVAVVGGLELSRTGGGDSGLV